MGLDVKKTEIMISSENAGLVKVEGMFPCTVWRKVLGSNSILKVVITKTRWRFRNNANIQNVVKTSFDINHFKET